MTLSMRRSRRVAAAAGLALSAAAASAQTTPGTELRYEVRLYDAANNDGWATSVDAFPGDRIEVRARAVFVGQGTVWSLWGMGYQPVISGWTSSDILATNAVLGRTGPNDLPNGVGPWGGDGTAVRATVADLPGEYGRLTHWGASPTSTSTFLRGFVGTGTAAGLLRIAQASITNWIGRGATSGATANNNVNGGGGVMSEWGIVRPTIPDASPLLFKFAFIVGTAGQERSLTISTPPAGFHRVLSNGSYVGGSYWWASNTEGVPSVQTDTIARAAVVRVVPGVGSSLMVVGGLTVGMKRRRR